MFGFTAPVPRANTYIAFDGDSDLMSYRTIQVWSADREFSFTLAIATPLVLLLVGIVARSLRRDRPNR